MKKVEVLNGIHPYLHLVVMIQIHVAKWTGNISSSKLEIHRIDVIWILSIPLPTLHYVACASYVGSSCSMSILCAIEVQSGL